MSSPRLMVCALRSWRRRSLSDFLWRAFTIWEFISLKARVYADYEQALRPELLRLKALRLAPPGKLWAQDALTTAVHLPHMARHLLALDMHTRSAPAFYRRLYVSLAAGQKLDERRRAVRDLATEWESEVAQWRHPFGRVLSSIVAPLKSVLGS